MDVRNKSNGPTTISAVVKETFAESPVKEQLSNAEGEVKVKLEEEDKPLKITFVKEGSPEVAANVWKLAVDPQRHKYQRRWCQKLK